ncbi:SDR family oxidoreductase [Peribacillus huizhouensis]|uniref:NADP-dependent 3-hydroxy acid dehydrogenase YdfG n=1 Tax=Peribacillus huizhouensis TaxID=1501239 RepID=A0ABR6CW53_9BACI|nr:SDR family oxidoreductase [Peribacillus huizhouensis]MBA9028918.1 NADP-dependent 3-hydroxy acid dehydrogenase YdfG [Peribacillus huizhouensis]
MSKVIVITGASSGIGEATAKLLASQGNKVVIAARRENHLTKMVEEIKAEGGKAAYKVTDVTKREQVESLVNFVIETYGQIDVWMNNAGIMPSSNFVDYNYEEWEAMIDINIKGVMYGIGAALPKMRERKTGHFINISSIAGHHVWPGGGIYSGTKFAVRAMSEGLRQEEALAGSNIRVTIVSPGAIETELVETISDPKAKAGMQALYDAVQIPASRVADTIAFAINSPEDTCLNEIIIRPTIQLP